MKTIKVTEEELYNSCVISSDIDEINPGMYDLELELTPKGMQLYFDGETEGRDNRFNITGEFGENDYLYLGFKII